MVMMVLTTKSIKDKYAVNSKKIKTKMPRKYTRGDRKNKWTDKQLELALDAVKKGEMNTHRAALKFGIPSSTLHDHVKGKSRKRFGGPPMVLTFSEEKEIVRVCETLQEFGFPLTKDIVSMISYVTTCET